MLRFGATQIHLDEEQQIHICDTESQKGDESHHKAHCDVTKILQPIVQS